MPRLTALLVALLFCSRLFSQVDFTDSNLPIVVIETGGTTIKDDIKINCDMGIIYNGPGVRNYLTDPFNNYDGRIGIEIRGSTSQQYPKKSYGLETRDSLGVKLNVSILGMPSENDWILYGAYPDKSLMRNEMTYSFFATMEPWSPRHVFCELIIDGDYKGVYSFMEKIKVDNDRIDIANLDSDDVAGDLLTGGYIIKIDKLTGSSLTTWTSPFQPKLKFLYHDPEDIELTTEQEEFIEQYVTDFETTLYNPGFLDTVFGYRAYIDVNSFVDFFIMQELGRTVDGYRSSSFMYKDKGKKLCAGPMWDFNLSYGNADYCAAYDTTGWQYNFADICDYFTTEPPEWWPRFLEDSIFTRQLRCRWEELRGGILNTDSVNAWIDSVALYLDESQDRNFERWDILGEYVNWNYFIGDTYEEEIDYLKWWMQARSSWLDEHIPGTCGTLFPDTIPFPEADTTTTSIFEIPQLFSAIYPNPFSEHATVVLNGDLSTEKIFRIYNLTGELVDEFLIPAGEIEVVIERKMLPAGLYHYAISISSGIISTGGFVISP